MYLSKLEIHGFKSFASATDLRFDPGITAVVGPNGCGKSNIVDAIRWVIGEQRASVLRSDKMHNVIFNGSARRHPLGMAEVKLTVENSRGQLPLEFSEITLGRRLYRSGDAEYLLNGTPCRLRDIRDLFVDTGMGAGAYSVIELKMIEEILSENAQDRRRLFEEAAGITKYKQRRTQALRKLDHTQADLARVRDVTDEIAKRVRSLKRQATTAARYKRLEGEAREMELSLAQADCNRLGSELAALEVELTREEDELTKFTSRAARYDADKEALRLKLQNAERTAQQNLQALQAHESQVGTLESDLRLARLRLEEADRDLARLQRDETTGRDRAASLLEEEEKLRRAHAKALPRVRQAAIDNKEAERQCEAAKSSAQVQRADLSALRVEDQAAADLHAAIQRQANHLSSRLEWLREVQERLGAEFEAAGANVAELGTRRTSANSVLSQASNVLNDAKAEVATAQGAHAELTKQIESEKARLETLGREHAATAAEVALLEGLVESYDEFPDAIRYLSSSTTRTRVRTLSDVVTCAPEYRAALAAALGAYAACIVVQSDDDALTAIAELKAQEKGRAMFLILDRLPEQHRQTEKVNVGVRALRDFVSVHDPTCEMAVNVVLRNVFLVHNLDEAVGLPGSEPGMHARYVTKTGEWLDENGFVHGGGAGKDVALSHLDRRDRMHTVKKLLTEQEVRLTDVAALLKELDAERTAIGLADRENRVRAAEKSQRQASQYMQSLDREIEIANNRREELQGQLDAVLEEVSSKNSVLKEIQPEAADATAGMEGIRSGVLEAEAKLQHVLTELQDAQDALTISKAELIGSQAAQERLEHDLERVRERQQELAGDASRRQSEQEQLQDERIGVRETIHRLEQELVDQHEGRGELEKAIHIDKTRLMTLRVDLDRLEDRLRKVRNATDEARQRENGLRVQNASLETMMSELKGRIADQYEVLLEPVPMEQEIEPAAVREQLDEIRRKMRTMGNVNALALAEYEDEKQRLEFLTGQCEDLETAEATLSRTIKEINVEASARFSETFRTIQQHFRRLFKELFGRDAACDLALEDPGDFMESPIAVTAKPRGKRPISIAQLSSGEKTLTAIALLFAIYLVKPSPFCFLDEVDAPLDDSNIDRFMRLIRRFAKDTQFILVTHNKRTMEMADRLYGITMQEQGVSRLVGVRFEEALAMAS